MNARSVSVRNWVVASIVFCAVFASGGLRPLVGQEVPADAEQLEPETDGRQLLKAGHRLFVQLSEPSPMGSITIPRICSSLRTIQWLGTPDVAPPELTPEPAKWIVRWTELPAKLPCLVLEFDSRPILLDELEPQQAAGDGSFMLAASHASTRGEKLRFEPQPNKNTIGYWTIVTDEVSWNLDIQATGEFNVGILQGCGAGQGGSRAVLSMELGPDVPDSLEFTVSDTGHFQNFIWRHLGVVRVTSTGRHVLRIKPIQIERQALMDVRAVYLSPARRAGPPRESPDP